MKYKIPLIPFFLTVFLLTAVGPASCSGNDDKRPESTEFPIPYPEDGEPITDTWDGNTGHRTIKYPADRHGGLVEFYDDYTSGTQWNRTEAGSGPTLSVLYINLERGHTIDLAPPGDQVADAVLITLFVSGE